MTGGDVGDGLGVDDLVVGEHGADIGRAGVTRSSQIETGAGGSSSDGSVRW